MRDHRVVIRVGVLLNVDIALDHPLGVIEERPVGSDAEPEVVETDPVIGRDRDQARKADAHLSVERHRDSAAAGGPSGSKCRD